MLTDHDRRRKRDEQRGTLPLKTDFQPARGAPAVHTVKISLEQRPEVEVEMIRASVWYFGVAIWAALSIWFVAGLPWL